VKIGLHPALKLSDLSVLNTKIKFDLLKKPEDVLRVSQILDELSVAFKWEKGDVVLVDNKQALHSRRPFIPPRRVLAALFQ